ncbi:MAG: hypothetical protein Q9165_006332 [Trypethelium subeluteriae]
MTSLSSQDPTATVQANPVNIPSPHFPMETPSGFEDPASISLNPSTDPIPKASGDPKETVNAYTGPPLAPPASSAPAFTRDPSVEPAVPRLSPTIASPAAAIISHIVDPVNPDASIVRDRPPAEVATSMKHPFVPASSGVVTGQRQASENTMTTIDGESNVFSADNAVLSSSLEAMPTSSEHPGHIGALILAGLNRDDQSSLASDFDGGISETAIFTLGSQAVTAIEEKGPDDSKIIVASSLTLAEGQAGVKESGISLSAGTSGIFLGSTLIALAPVTTSGTDPNMELTTKTQAIFTIGASTVKALQTEDPNGREMVAVGSDMLHAGGSPIVLDGTTISDSNSALVLASGGSTTEVPFSAAAVAPVSAVTIESTLDTTRSFPFAFKEVSSPGDPPIILIGSQTLTVGGDPLTTSGATLSAGDAGLVIISDSQTSTESLRTYLGNSEPTTATEAFFTIGKQVFTAIEQPGDSSGPHVAVFGSKTITIDGAPIITAGETISADASALMIISGGTTSVVPFSNTLEGTSPTGSDPSSTGAGSHQTGVSTSLKGMGINTLHNLAEGSGSLRLYLIVVVLSIVILFL